MLNVCVIQMQQGLCPRRTYQSNALVGTSNLKITELLRFRRQKLLRQAAKMLSFSRALKFAAAHAQLSKTNQNFLLKQSLLLKEQLFCWNNRIRVDNKFAGIKLSICKQINTYSGRASTDVCDVIVAINTANLPKLAIALDLTITKLDKVVQMFKGELL